MLQLIKRPLSILFICWLCAVLIQLPNLNRPLSKHHEFNMAMIMIVVKSWQNAGGATNYHFTPIINYGNSGDKYFGEDSLVVNGKYYYPSFGPMQFILPYSIARVFNLPISPLLVQLLGLVVLFCVVVLLYKICLLFLSNQLVALFTAVLFLFFPGTLWYYSNGFVHESLASLFYLYIFYYCFLTITKLKKVTVLQHCLLVLAVFFGFLTDWYIAVVVAFSSLFLVLYYFKLKSKDLLYAALLIALSSVTAFLLLYYAYSTEMSPLRLWQNIQYKFNLRSGDTLFSLVGIKNIGLHFITLFGVILIAIPIAFITKINLSFKQILYLILPPVFYTILFSNYSLLHEYASLKFMLPIVILMAFCLNYFFAKKRILVVVTLVCFCNIGIYYFINKPAYTASLKKVYGLEKGIGEAIASNVNPNEFIVSDLIEKNNLAIMYYAQRNIRFVNSEQEAVAYKNKAQLEYVLFFSLKNDIVVIKKLY